MAAPVQLYSPSGVPIGTTTPQQARHLRKAGAKSLQTDAGFGIELTREQAEKFMSETNPQPDTGPAAQANAFAALYAHRGLAGSSADYWKRPEGDALEVWLMNMSPMVISRQLDTDTGPQEFYVPKMTEPVCATDQFTFETLKESKSFRSLCNATQPESNDPMIRLMTEAEVFAALSKIARANRKFLRNGQPDVSWAAQMARQKFRRIAGKETQRPTKPALHKDNEQTIDMGPLNLEPPETLKELAKSGNMGGLSMANPEMLQQLKPQFQSIMSEMMSEMMATGGYGPGGPGEVDPNAGLISAWCSLADPELPFEERLSETDLASNLEALWPDLKLPELKRLMDFGVYPRIKAKAAKLYIAAAANQKNAAVQAKATREAEREEAEPYVEVSAAEMQASLQT